MSFDDVVQSAPLIVVSLGALIVLLGEAFSRGRAATTPRTYLAAFTLVTLGIAALLSAAQWTDAATPRALYHGMLAVDRFSIVLNEVVFVGAALAVLLAGGFLREHRFEFGEFYAVVLLSTAGMVIMDQAADLVSLFLGIETMSLGVYVLTGSWRRSARSSEAAMKYFLVGAFASAILIYGIALVYGTSGTSNLVGIGAQARGAIGSDPVFWIGALLILVALGFKVAAVPFHMWAPDAYDGAPTPVTAFMAATVKAAGFGALVRVFTTAAGPGLAFGAAGWASTVAVLAVLTMTLGNVAALRQESIKRMLAYSSIAHAGYLMIGVVALAQSDAARGPLLYYLLSYTFATIGTFGLVAWYGSRGDERHLVEDWAGLGGRHPAAALAMTVLLLSLAGIPPTAGFFGKFYLFRAALEQRGLVPLVIIAVANSLVSVFYYLRIVTAMYFREVGRAATPLRSPGVHAALWIATLGTVAIGVLPGWLVEIASNASLLK